MDDVLSGVLMLTVAAAVIATAIAIAIAMATAGGLIGGIVVAVRGTSSFVGSMGRAIAGRGGAARQPTPPEPAYELYVLGQFRRDLRAAFAEAWRSMQDARHVTGQWADRHGSGVTMPLAIGAVMGALVGTVLGTLFGVLLAIPVVLVAAAVVGLSWGLIIALRLAEGLRRRARRTSYECPVDHERFPLPVYVCPGCHAEHHRLVPGRWGIVKRECGCGQTALPTMVLNGRQRVPQRCPSGHPLSGMIGYAEILRIALVAGPSAGKSTFLAGALHELDRMSATGTIALGVLDDSRSDFETALRSLADGVLPKKTSITGNPALVAEVQGGGTPRVLSLYDVAGESYGEDDAIRQLRFLETASGLVILVDPLSLDRVASDHRGALASIRDRVRPSTEPPMRVLERTLGVMAEAGARAADMPVAVVVTKSDALGIGDEIDALIPVAGDLATREWLVRQGAGNFVRAVEQAFEGVGWSHATALGRTPQATDRRPFEPAGTVAPLLELLKKKGVAPAAERFTPARTAERLRSGDASDFPPISRGGWAMRVVPAGAFAAAVCVAAGIVAVGFVRGLDLDGSERAQAAVAAEAARARGAVEQWAGGARASDRCRVLSRRRVTAEFGGRYAAAFRRCRLELSFVDPVKVAVVRVRLDGDGESGWVVVADRRRGRARYAVRLSRTTGQWGITATAGDHGVDRQRVRALVNHWGAATAPRIRCRLLTPQARRRMAGANSAAGCVRRTRRRVRYRVRRLSIDGNTAAGRVFGGRGPGRFVAVKRHDVWRLSHTP